ncbi:MAG: hypothetical protein ACK5KT_03905 [Dysgonomonas sp.]
MKLIEQYIQSKTGNNNDCEDEIFFSNDFAAVIDGATSKSALKYKNRFLGKVSSIILKHSLKSLDLRSSAEDAISYLTERIYKFYQENNMTEHVIQNPVDRPSASIVIYSKFRNEIWMVGDCQCMIDNNKYYNKKLIDELLSNVRSLYLQMEEILGHKVTTNGLDVGREFIKPLLEKQSLFQNSNINSDYTYGVIDGFEVPKDEIKKIIVPPKVKSIILASDGYPILCSTLKQSEKKLQDILDQDPMCYKEYKTTKGIMENNVSFDDRAYIRIQRD